MKRKGQGGIGAVFCVIFVLLMAVITFGVDTVPASHIGVMEQFGKIKGEMDPGIKWTGMFVRVEKFDYRTKNVEVVLDNEQSAFDNTAQAVYATINVNYRILPTDGTAMRLYTEVGKSRVVADKLNLNARVIEGFKQATSQYEALDILNKQQEVKELAKENIRANFPSEYFEIQNIVITNIDFSPAFKQAIEDKKVAEQNALMEENKLEAVRFQQLQEIEKAKAEAEKMRLQKTQLTELLNQQKWIEAWNGVLPTTVILSSDTGGMDMLLNIPTGVTEEEE